MFRIAPGGLLFWQLQGRAGWPATKAVDGGFGSWVHLKEPIDSREPECGFDFRTERGESHVSIAPHDLFEAGEQHGEGGMIEVFDPGAIEHEARALALCVFVHIAQKALFPGSCDDFRDLVHPYRTRPD